ncbi:DUF6090 family protein [Williamwhitmania taraxaci]|uniref:Uncharacterized protein n=1 Tax=Williamwhitmania taraxaci TaxID=1640674 RepID=A0A1G6NC11_9BACT|nr:DUF6090 family protein [Williamwhitmania taraxaci]SDC65353.1 hypothetical protein SAMN05216323_10428 [Williamwhitmania taraxaci]
MKKVKKKLSIDWKSKSIDLLIVIIGITTAFQLNNLNESNKSKAHEKDYLKSFYVENRDNEANLIAALKFSESNKNDIDTLKYILLSKNYADKRIKILTASMMGVANYTPSITTMENVTASGEFELIEDIELRKQIILTYNTYNVTLKLESLLSDYINKYVTPFLFENIRFSNLSPINSTFIKDPLFENIVIGYEVLLTQQIKGYQDNLEKIKLLNNKLTTANK